MESGSKWTQDIYTCATGIEASVKEVTFSFNGSSSLDNLGLIVEDKIYGNDSSMPLWAVENPGVQVAYINPLWGLVSDEYENNTSLFTKRAKSLWLPAVNPVLPHHP
jgi:hypothetical protein